MATTPRATIAPPQVFAPSCEERGTSASSSPSLLFVTPIPGTPTTRGRSFSSAETPTPALALPPSTPAPSSSVTRFGSRFAGLFFLFFGVPRTDPTRALRPLTGEPSGGRHRVRTVIEDHRALGPEQCAEATIEALPSPIGSLSEPPPDAVVDTENVAGPGEGWHVAPDVDLARDGFASPAPVVADDRRAIHRVLPPAIPINKAPFATVEEVIALRDRHLGSGSQQLHRVSPLKRAVLLGDALEVPGGLHRLVAKPGELGALGFGGVGDATRAEIRLEGRLRLRRQRCSVSFDGQLPDRLRVPPGVHDADIGSLEDQRHSTEHVLHFGALSSGGRARLEDHLLAVVLGVVFVTEEPAIPFLFSTLQDVEFVVAERGDGSPARNQLAHTSDHRDAVGAAVDEVTDEHQRATRADPREQALERVNLPVWKRHPNLLGSDRLDWSLYSGDTNTWSAPARLTGNVSNGFYDFTLAAAPAGTVLLAYQTNARAVLGARWSAGTWTVSPSALITPAQGPSRLALASSANGTGMLLVGEVNSALSGPVHAIAWDGTAWGTATQIGQSIDINPRVGPVLGGTGWTYRDVGDLKVVMDATGNALAVWIAPPTNQVQGGLGSYGLGISAYYTAGTGWGSHQLFTDSNGVDVLEFTRNARSSGLSTELGLSLQGGRAVVTYAADPGRPVVRKAQLKMKTYEVSTHTWSNGTVVDGHPDQTQGHSRVFLEAGGAVMTIYEAWPVGSLSAGLVRARSVP